MDDVSLIYKDEDFLALYKPAGLLTHPVKSPKFKDQNSKPKEPTLTDWLLKNFPEVKNIGDPSINSGQVDPSRPGIVHRLDKETSGIILIPRNQNYFNYLKRLFQNHQVKKTYLALVYGKVEPKSGIIEKPIRLKSGSTKRTIWKGKMQKEAITDYKVVKYVKPNFSLVRVIPKTGRTHQIRVHLASIGHPIVGDALYGPKTNSFGLNRQFLHAESVEFASEDGRRIKIESELPRELERIVDDLGFKM